MKVYPILAGSVDEEDTLVGIHKTYDGAMGYAMHAANITCVQARQDDNVEYSVFVNSGAKTLKGEWNVMVHDHNGPDRPDFWWIITEMEVLD